MPFGKIKIRKEKKIISRMKILNNTEQTLFDKPPIFDSHQRKHYFDIPVNLLKLANKLRKPIHKIGFLVTCGYFKATKIFFSPEDYYERDIEFVIRHFYLSGTLFNTNEYSRSRIHHHRQVILKTYGFCPFDKSAEMLMQNEITEVVKAQLTLRNFRGKDPSMELSLPA